MFVVNRSPEWYVKSYTFVNHLNFRFLPIINLQFTISEALFTWKYVSTILDAVHRVLIGLITFSPASKPKGNTPRNGNSVTASNLYTHQHQQLNRGVPKIASINGNIAAGAALSNSHHSVAQQQHSSLLMNPSPSPSVSPLVSPSDGFSGFFNNFGDHEPHPGTSIRKVDSTIDFHSHSGGNVSINEERHSHDRKQQIWDLLAESQMLRAKMKSLQGRYVISQREYHSCECSANVVKVNCTNIL